MIRSITTLMTLAMVVPAQGVTIQWRSPQIGDYRIIYVDDIESADGFLYDVTVAYVPYEVVDQEHHFFHPLDVRLGFVQAVADAQIPLEDVRVFPQQIHWVENRWTERYDALYDTPFMLQCDTACDPNEQTMLSVAGIEYNTLGVSFGDSWAVRYWFAIVRRDVFGDVDRSGFLDVGDIDELTRMANGGPGGIQIGPNTDFNNDRVINGLDIGFWLKDVFGTWRGDINLDRLFDSTDLIELFSKGKYESDRHAVWSDGDFTGDGWVNSNDLILALADGGYEAGPFQKTVVVPEPSFLGLLFVSLVCIYRRRFNG